MLSPVLDAVAQGLQRGRERLPAEAPRLRLVEGAEGLVQRAVLLDQLLVERQEPLRLRGDAHLVEPHELLPPDLAAEARARLREVLEYGGPERGGAQEAGAQQAFDELLLADVDVELQNARRASLVGVLTARLALRDFAARSLGLI